MCDAAVGRTPSLWAKAMALNATQWRCLLISSLLLPAIDIGLRTLGFRRTVALLARLATPRVAVLRRQQDADANVDRIARVVGIAGRRSLWRTSCLRQALCLWFLLARRGVASQVRIGVEKPAGSEFAAHAWVERHGQVLIGGDKVQERYVVLL